MIVHALTLLNCYAWIVLTINGYLWSLSRQEWDEQDAADYVAACYIAEADIELGRVQ